MKNEKRVDHLDIVLKSKYPSGYKPDEEEYKDALAFMQRHIPPELGWKVEGEIVYEEASDEQ